jgi:hypothetical protein
MYVKIGWRPLEVQNIFNIYNNVCNRNNNKHRKVYKLLNCKRKEWRNNLLLKSIDQQNYRYHLVGWNPQRDSYFKFKLGRRMVHELGSFVDGSGDLMTQTSTPKSMEEVVGEVMKINKAAKLFQTMAIANMNMGNLTLEVNILKNVLVTKEKEKVMLQEELDKERNF